MPKLAQIHSNAAAAGPSENGLVLFYCKSTRWTVFETPWLGFRPSILSNRILCNRPELVTLHALESTVSVHLDPG